VTRAAVEGLAAWFEGMTPASLADIARYYADDAWFKDPFNEVRGVEPIRAVFARMFEQVDAPRFSIRQCVVEDAEAFLVWDMHFRFRGSRRPQCIHGSSHIRLSGDGRVIYHRDYWDTGEELYAKIPGLGMVFRWLRRRAH